MKDRIMCILLLFSASLELAASQLTLEATCSTAPTGAEGILRVSCTTDFDVDRYECSFDGGTAVSCDIPFDLDTSEYSRSEDHILVIGIFPQVAPTTRLEISLDFPGTMDISPITIGFTQPEYEVNESSDSVMVTIESPTVTDRSVQIRISTSDLTALASMDYTSVDTTVVLMAGSTSWSVPISIIDDDFIEPNERFVVTMETADSGVELGRRRAEVVIRTDDDCPTSSALTSDRFIFSSDPLLIRCMSVCNQHLKRGRICPNL